MNKYNHPYSFKFHFSNPWPTEEHGGRDLNLKQDSNWHRQSKRLDFFGSSRVQVILKHFGHFIYIVYIGLLFFISYEMHLVELRCSKSASL